MNSVEKIMLLILYFLLEQLQADNGSTDEAPSLEWREIRFRWDDSKWISQEPYFSEVYDISEMLLRYLVHTKCKFHFSKCKYNSTAIGLD